jgi:8-oxo-dGTP pyrophosphatase MutT (NUDIX family)
MMMQSNALVCVRCQAMPCRMISLLQTEVLLGRDAPSGATLSLLGGKSDPHERPHETAVREFHEETGAYHNHDMLTLIGHSRYQLISST